ncbi:heterokaryon incompatibility protein-domain-containing protein [Podospora didyma]|uniref:Heterokaryon incompatibility protein-domain-containing protein n=1 Tax=Podospora didyma TaxID=330526 RepID=A0AAE0N2L7_9PEZI|nr:heterokaryon incompatibility protein-domain-containing protein [Podospora didyma]
MPDSLSRPIKIETLKTWLATCDAQHAEHCRAGQITDDNQLPTWLVDVSRQCIVHAQADLKYIALSYVWGRAASVSLTRSTLDKLMNEGSLDEEVLPRTIRDAMNLATALDIGYLWVDRLCIVQDDDAEKHAQIKAMGSIYARSHFTLIAAQSHDASGPLTSRPLRLSPPPSWASGLITPVVRTIAVWFSRGWTFQEFLFSRRKVVFHNNTVNWECHCSSAHENQELRSLTLSPCLRQTTQTSSLGVDIDPWPNFHRYARLAALFTPRFLTYPEDVLDAFAGASAAFAQIYPGGMVTGMPAMVFDAALIWQPYHPLERRKPNVLPDREAILPSWSWVSWRGELHSEAWQSGYNYLRRQPNHDPEGSGDGIIKQHWTTISTVKWSHSSTLTSERHPIPVLADEWRKKYTHPSSPPPPTDWQRHNGQITKAASFFTHPSVPGHEFWYPIPIGVNNHGRASRSRYLHTTTRHAHAEPFPKTSRSFGSGCAVLALKAPDGRQAGCLRLNDMEQNTRGNTVAEKCHLIELSAGEVALDEYVEDLRDHPLADYEFYNVMWVEWKGGVAYRRAVGRVEKAFWEAAAVEINLLLG